MKKIFRIKKTQEFQGMIQKRKFAALPSMVYYYQPRKEERCRVGISVSKKMGNAVIRNKVKRQVRSMLDECYPFDGKFDGIFIIRTQYHAQSFQVNKKDLETLLKKVKID